jgi:UDP-2-acetamido-2-deoxy-ribo-hexuluronate aminotransferase
MQFRDLRKQYNALKEQMDNSVLDVMSRAEFIMGREVKELEDKLSEYVSKKHCITCANGTDALKLALMCWGIGKGDAVFIPDFTFFATGEVVAELGATPVFVDIDKDTFNISPQDLENSIVSILEEGKLTPKVIIAVDLFGLPANYEELKKIAKRHKLYILEDGAQGFGGAIKINNNWHRACSFGDISTTSFFPSKPLGCYGDGGAIFTDNDEWANTMNSLKVHGKGSSKYDNIRIGMNSRLDTLQAAILLVKFNAFITYELNNINIAALKYTEKLSGEVDVPLVPNNYYSSWAQYTIKFEDSYQRELVINNLSNNSVPSMIFYPKPMHKQEAFRYDYRCFSGCDISNNLTQTVLSLPLHPYIEDKEIDLVAEIIVKSKNNKL